MTFRTLMLATLVATLSGCATVMEMPFSANNEAPPPADKAIYLMTVTTRNNYHTSYQPDMLVLNVERPDAKNSADRFNFKIDDQGKTETESPQTGNSYFVRFDLPPGDYVIQGVTCMSKHFPFIVSFFAPLHEKLTVTSPGAYYLGHVDATVRERVGDEFKAGPTVPLIDQGVGGASGGTFDIAITDDWAMDEGEFNAKFSGLMGVSVHKQIMTPFDRVYAQKWWDEH